MTPELASSKTMKFNNTVLTVKEVYDLFNEGRGYQNGWCGWNPFNHDATKTVCDCGSINETSDFGVTCWVPAEYGSRYKYDLAVELEALVE